MVSFYRFKTELEFIQEYGESWRHIYSLDWSRDMDYLFGLPVPESAFDEHGQLIKHKRVPLYPELTNEFKNGWYLRHNIIKPAEHIQQILNYKLCIRV